jgi:hypothetical protein
MKILYAARMARFDLLRAVCDLACFVTRWTVDCDRRLHRLVCYIASTKHLRQIGWVGDKAADLAPHLFADADFAGCNVTQRSTSGGHLAIMGPNSCFPQSGKSGKQGAIALSTPEAEWYSGHVNLKSLGLPSKDLWDIILQKKAPLYFHEDNQAMIQVVKNGRNPTMRHLGRVHRVAVAWLHERWLAGDFIIFYEKSELMAADIYTKGFSDKGKWTAVCWLINVVDPKVLKGMIQYNKEVKERLDAEDAVKTSAKAEEAKKTPKEKATAKAKSKAVAKAKSATDVNYYACCTAP